MKTQYAVIVGASKGIGQAVAITLAKLRYQTILIGRSKEGLEQTATACGHYARATVIAGDITSELPRLYEEIQSCTSEINFLWLGAAGFSEAGVSELSPSSIRELLRSGYESLVEFVHLSYPLLKIGKAHIVGACSDWSDFHSGGPSVFGSTKVALAGFLDKLSQEVKADGIKTTALKMGNVGNLEGYGLDDHERQRRETGTRLVTLRDVCDTVEFILTRKTATVAEITLLPGA